MVPVKIENLVKFSQSLGISVTKTRVSESLFFNGDKSNAGQEVSGISKQISLDRLSLC